MESANPIVRSPTSNNRGGSATLSAVQNVCRHLADDTGAIVTSVVIAYLLVRTGAISDVVQWADGYLFLKSFVAGMFFTSVFTTAPAVVLLAEIADVSQSVFLVAFVGALGAMTVDLFIFRFIRDNLGDDVFCIIGSERGTKMRSLFRLKFFRWFTFLLGGLIIASPLPDELGLAMLGLSKTHPRTLIAVSYVFNFLGILAIGLVATHIPG